MFILFIKRLLHFSYAHSIMKINYCFLMLLFTKNKGIKKQKNVKEKQRMEI